MAEVVARDEKFVREHEPREKALAEFERDGDFMKTHFVTKFTEPGSEVSFYRNGKFVDFCRGPHVPSTGRVKAVKMTALAGAYWLGDEKNPQLQRIHGTAFFSQKDLDAHFARLEEAAKRDHRLLGKQLDLFSIQELAGAGLIFWHPKGAMIRKIMEDWMRDECLRRGYQLVYTPHVAKREPVADLGTRRLLRGQHVYAHGTGRCELSHEADELSVPHSHLQEFAEELSRPAGALCRAGQRVPLRALRHHARFAARARLYAGRRAHLLHAQPD
jgi:threonyl-tRNA synthetase